MKTPRYSFIVTIEQEDPEEGRNFGSKENWADSIKVYLDRHLHMANVVEVRPTRTTKAK